MPHIKFTGFAPAGLLVLLLAINVITSAARADDVAQPIQVKAVVVTMFEIGADSGDQPGEFQLWKKREHLDRRIPLPTAYHDAWFNPKTGVLGVLTGVGTANAVSTITSLGLDRRLDLSHAYWIVAGIAGGDPEDTSLGSAVWARYVVDGDLAHEIDAREIPNKWSTGYIPLFQDRPYAQPRPKAPNALQVFKLDFGLTQWAYERTRRLALPDTNAIAAVRKRYGEQAAQQPPRVQIGDNLAAMTFWHGRRLNAWANRWVKYWTGGQGEFVTSAMEDSGTLLALHRLGSAGLVDPRRILVLRTVSNYTTQHAGQTAAESLADESSGFSGLTVAVESAYRVGSTVLHDLLAHWSAYADTLPAPDRSPQS